MAQFRINHSKVIRQADEMTDLSRQINSEIIRLENLLARIKREWYVPASDAFQQQLIMLIADMKTTRYNMTSVSTSIKNVANRIQNEDERLAAKLAQG